MVYAIAVGPRMTAVSLGGAHGWPTHGIGADWRISKRTAHQTHNAESDARLMAVSIPASNLLVTWVGYGRLQLAQGFVNVTVFEVVPLKTFGLLSFVILAIWFKEAVSCR